MTEKQYEQIIITPKEHSEVEVTGVLTTSSIEAKKPDVLKKIASKLSIDGFREGHVPEAVALKHVGEMKLLEEVALALLERAYPEIVLSNNLEVIGRPEVAITKIAPGNPIEFRIRTAVIPTVTLPEYETIAASLRKEWEKSTVTLSDEEFESVLTDIRKRHALLKKKELDSESTATIDDIKTEDLVTLTDDMVGEFGEFSSVGDFHAKLRTDLERDKQFKEKEKQRAAMADAIAEKTTVDVPTIFVESELDKMLTDMNAHLSRMNVSLEDYLSHTGKTKEAIKEEWRGEATKRATLQLALSTIAKKEGLVPESERVSKEVAHLLIHYPDANPDALESYVSTLMMNDMVFTYLETGVKPKEPSPIHDHDHEDHHDHNDEHHA